MVEMVNRSMTEREILGDAVGISFVNHRHLAETAETLGVFGLGQVTASGAGAHDFAGAGDFKPLGYGFSGLNTFGASHKFN
jgi:hypothetical protein